MKPRQDKTQEAPPQLIQRRGFYLDILKYAETRPVSLDSAQSESFLEAYNRLKSSLGHASYTDVARALGIPPLDSHATRQASSHPLQGVGSSLLKQPTQRECLFQIAGKVIQLAPILLSV